jgi:hypothetical protein
MVTPVVSFMVSVGNIRCGPPVSESRLPVRNDLRQIVTYAGLPSWKADSVLATADSGLRP